MRPQRELTKKQEEQLASIEDGIRDIEIKDNIEEEIVVHWVNKYGVPVNIKTRRGGLIHALWLAEHEKRSRKRIAGIQTEQPDIIDIQPEIIACQQPKGVSPDNICQKQL